MQNRMKTHVLTEEKIAALLNRAQVGTLATLNADGAPYNTPVHFVYAEGKIYIHGLPKGQKLDNIARSPQAGFYVFELQGFLLDPDGKPCGTNTKYESVIATARAALLQGAEKKKAILAKIIEKYTPHLKDAPVPEAMLAATAIIELEILELTGKYSD